jgi:hypothetical protein
MEKWKFLTLPEIEPQPVASRDRATQALLAYDQRDMRISKQEIARYLYFNEVPCKLDVMYVL